MKLELSVLERLQLINQFEIRKALAKDKYDIEHFDEVIQVLREGYESEYGRMIQLFDVFTESQSRFVSDVLSMYRCIEDYKERNPKDTEVAEAPCSHFMGFDGNNEGRYLGFARFLFEKKDYFTEQKKYAKRTDGFNSHMPTLDTYSRMLDKFKSFGEHVHELSRAQVLAILAEAIHPENRKARPDDAIVN